MNEGPLELFFGRLHPMVLHAPIGLLIALAALELLAIVRRRPIARDVVVPLAWLTAAAAILTALTGLTLSQEAATPTATLGNHKLLGIAVASGATLAAAITLRPAWLVFYRAMLLLTVGFLVPAGHLGASMTHGENFLTEPFAAPKSPPLKSPDAAPSPGNNQPDTADATEFQAVAIVFATRCSACHGPERQRGGLALHAPDTIRAGGKHGLILVAGKPAESELIRRLRLPLDDRSHMPPPARPQPDAREIELIERWIAAGAPMSAETVSTNGAGASNAAEPTNPAQAPADPPPDPAAIEALRGRLIHVEPLARDSAKIWIDCSAAGRSVSDADLRALLAPLRGNIAGLGLARTLASHETIAIVAEMPALTRLDLSSTAVDDSDISKLTALTSLEELVLTRTNLTEAALPSLQALSGLRRLYVWKSGLTDASVAALRAVRPTDLLVDAGDRPDTPGTDAESELKFTSDAPLPGPAPVAAAASLQPVNTTCPVSGTPVDPKYVVVWKGRAIGFCCPNCPSKFWADPAAFESKLPPAPTPASP